MGMNIKSEKAHLLARRLAEESGTSITAIIETVLEAEVARRERDRDIEERRRRIRGIVERFGPVPPGVTSDHSDLYDEWGLPK